jgi:Fe-S cluster biogenesis protein NfuA
MSMNNGEFQSHAQQLNELVERTNGLSDENARSVALQLLQSVMDLHGAVITRVVETLTDSGEAGRKSLAELGRDPLICGLLVLYGVHPVAMEERIANAIEGVRPQLQKQGGSVELLGISDSAVRLKLQHAANGGNAPAEKMKHVIEQAILEAAPEVVQIVVEGAPSPGFVPLESIQQNTQKVNRYEESAA